MAHAQIVPIGGINIFIGYVSTGSEDLASDNQAGDMEEVSDNIEQPVDGNYEIDYNPDDYGDSIRPVLDEVDYGLDPEPLSDDFTNTIGVYATIGNTDAPSDPLLTPITAENAVTRAVELEAAQLAMVEVNKAIAMEQKKAKDETKVLESQRKELGSIDA
jgi:hypothetical protein